MSRAQDAQVRLSPLPEGEGIKYGRASHQGSKNWRMRDGGLTLKLAQQAAPEKGELVEQIYPAGPSAAPDTLTKSTSTYKRHAWFALGALTLFVVLYFLLAG